MTSLTFGTSVFISEEHLHQRLVVLAHSILAYFWIRAEWYRILDVIISHKFVCIGW